MSSNSSTTGRTFFRNFAMGSLTALMIAGAAASPAAAALMSVSGPNSSAGTAAAIIAAPTFAQNSMRAHTGQLGFDEVQNLTLLSALDTDAGIGTIASGTTVSSHMIFLNQPDGINTVLTHFGVEWTFTAPIIGVMSDMNGDLEAASNSILGAVGTTYEAPFFARGLEVNNGTGLGDDGYQLIDPFTIRVGMLVTQPGDWIRVVTAAPVPVPAAVWMFMTAIASLFGIGWVRRRGTASA